MYQLTRLRPSFDQNNPIKNKGCMIQNLSSVLKKRWYPETLASLCLTAHQKTILCKSCYPTDTQTYKKKTFQKKLCSWWAFPENMNICVNIGPPYNMLHIKLILATAGLHGIGLICYGPLILDLDQRWLSIGPNLAIDIGIKCNLF